MFYAGEAWGADVTISVTFNATYKPQNGVSLIDNEETYGTASCNTASSNRAIIRNTSSLTISATKEGWTLKSVGLTWRGSNDPANTSVLTITGGTFNSLTSITPSSSTVVIGSESTNNNYQISAITVVFTEGSTCSATQPGTISKGTVSGGVITLTADGDPATGETWYWQDAADGTVTSVSGKTRNVSAPGTYYIRSYKASETCWSAASSVTVAAEDFYTPSETPNITVQPSSGSATYDKGDAATALSVTASVSDGGTLSYQWYSNTTATNSGGTLISGAESDTYTPSTATAGTLYYYCVVTNTLAGHTSVSATSNVSGAITVNSDCPGAEGGEIYSITMKNVSLSSVTQNTEVALATTYATESGGTAYLGNKNSDGGKAQVSTTGSGTIYFNGSDAYVKIDLECPIQTGDILTITNGEGSRQVSVTTTSTRAATPATVSGTYTFTDVFDGVSTIYLWRAEGSSTYVHSITITRPVDCTPNDLAYAETAVSKQAGDAAFVNTLTNPHSLPVTYSSSVPAVATVASDGTVSIEGAGTTVIKATYSGTAYCKGEVSYTLTVTLSPSAAPTITVQPVGASYDAGETVTPLSVTATGSGTLSYQWQKNGVDIPGATSSSYTPNASGSYTCVVSNAEAGHSATSVTSNAAVVNIKSNTYILQGISGTDGTGTLTGDFYTGATTMVSVPSTSYDGVSYTKGVQLGGGVTGWSNMSYHDRMVRYDCKTTHTEFTIVVYNKNGSAKKIYVGDIKENPIGTANTESSLSSYSVSGTSSLTQTYTIDNDKLTPASLYITVESTDIRIVQVIANETGTPLPTPGSVGYTLNFNKPRIGVRSGEKAWLDDTDFEYAPNSNAAAGYSERIQVGAKGTNYIQFRTDQPSAVKIGVQKNPEFYVADDKAGTLNAITIPKKSTDGGAIYTVMVDAGMHYIVPNGSNLSVTSLQILSASKITLSATGAYNKYTSSVTAVKDNDMPEIAILPSRSGYVFGGYYDEPDGAGTQYYDGLGNSVRPWDKDVETATLYAYWMEPCDVAPTLKKIVPEVTIWDGQEVDMSLIQLSHDFDAAGIEYSLVSASENIPGCTFSYFDERIYLRGIPKLENTSTVTKTITFTVTNNCASAPTYTAEATIRIYPANQKPKIAFIIRGKEGGEFNDLNYNTNEDPKTDEAACNALVTYLRTFYDVTYVNGYATQDATAMENFYKDYDLLIITDFLDTNEGYTNALGTLIDKKPILSFEAYGAKLSNWHIGSNPTEPDPKVKKMKILCAGHAIFKDAKYLPGDATETQVVIPADTTVNVLSTISGEGLQGFVINEAPDFIFLATVRDEKNKRDLIVCCERQIVFPARLLLYGINYNEMGNLTQAGQIVMRQMIDYLLMTDETKVADCSLVFDDNNGTHVWSDPKNWFPGYNIVPTPYHPTRIIAECHVDIDYAHAGSVKVNKGKDALGNPVDGILIVEPYGGLTVAGMVAKVNDTRYASPTTIKAEDLLIKANASGNGSFVYGNKESDVRATVEYYSLGEGAESASPVWQYIGIPFQASKTAINMYYEAWMCRWAEGSTDNLGGLWQWVDNSDVLVPFEGYCITQTAKKTYTFTGKLNAPVTTTVELDNRDADGYAFAANSWTAPIKIQEMQDDDFTNAEKSIYIYHSGTYDDWTSNGDPVNAKDGAVATLPGQYAVVPIHSSPYLAGADSVIPAMQGFFVKAIDPSADAEVKLVYNRVVYDATYFKTSTQPMRAPRRAAQDNAPEVMVLTVVGDKVGGDRVHILSRPDFSENYEDGWDGRKIAGDEAVPMLSVLKGSDSMAVAAVPTAEERYLTFRAGEDSIYTFCFDYEGETIYLYDMLTEEATEIKTGNTYSFTAVNKTPAPRFLITKNPPRTPTAIEQSVVSGQHPEVQKMIIDGQLYILHDRRFYDARGTQVLMPNRKEGVQ